MGKRYIATTINPAYNGMIARVRFTEGRAVVDEAAAKGTTRDLPEVVRVLEDLGITLKEVFKCEVCDKEFESQKALSGHGKAHAKKEEADGMVEEAV